MRKIEYLSPTSINTFKKDPKKFYQDYLADSRSVKSAQTGAMSIGSAFDAYVKSALVKDMFGEATGRFDLETLLSKQVSPSLLDWARVNGKYVFESYVRSGAYGEILAEIRLSSRAPRLEYTSNKPIVGGDAAGSIAGDIGGVPLLGKPDLDFVDSGGNDVTLDWKVNGYCSKAAVSPMPGFSLVTDGWDESVFKRSKSHFMSHVDFVRSSDPGMRYNLKGGLEDYSEEWANQLSIYSWLGGKSVGSHFICAIDQLACDTTKATPFPLIRVARHRARISKSYQEKLYSEIVGIWAICQSGYIFRDMSEDKSRELQEHFDRGIVQDEDTAFLKGNMKQGYK
jgi:hypothetical protein